MAAMRSTQRWKNLTAHVKATRPPRCELPICHAPTRRIDMTLPGTHKWGPQVDHLIELQDDGPMWDEANLALSHAHCNRRKGRARQHQRKQEQLRARARRIEQATLEAIAA